MDTEALRVWAAKHGSTPPDGPDRDLSITSRVIRFQWNGAPAAAVGAEVDGKTRINTVLDGVAWCTERYPSADTLHLLVGRSPNDKVAVEHLQAMGTLAALLESGPSIRLWQVKPDGAADEVEVAATTFTETDTSAPVRWAGYLEGAWGQRPTGLAAELLRRLDHPSVALYPKLSSQTGDTPWQLRLDGLEIGRVGADTGRLELATRNLSAAGEPRDQWRKVVVERSMGFDSGSLDRVVGMIHDLIARWSKNAPPGAVLAHGQAEHALEAHVLSGRVILTTQSCGALRLAAPVVGGVLRAAQFPTLWGDVASPARYLDALLADEQGRPWAIELKDQDAGGGNGAYLRAGIGQAVLYRHYIRSIAALDTWFSSESGLGLDRRQCQAAVAFPTAVEEVSRSIQRHYELAARWGVEIIEFPRPGTT